MEARAGIDRTQEPAEWAHVLRSLAQIRVPAYGYVNNHYAGHSPENERALQRALGQQAVEPGSLGEQTSLF